MNRQPVGLFTSLQISKTQTSMACSLLLRMACTPIGMALPALASNCKHPHWMAVAAGLQGREQLDEISATATQSSMGAQTRVAEKPNPRGLCNLN